MKKSSKTINLILVGSVIFLLCTAIILSFIMGGNHHDEFKDLKEELNLQNVVSSKYFEKHPDQNINLSFEDKNYSINSNPAEKLQAITEELYVAPVDAQVFFRPDSDEVFVFSDESYGREVDVNNLALYIRENLKNKLNNTIAIPTSEIKPNITRNELESSIVLRSEFSTSIVGSEAGRKHNVATAIKAFNGKIIMPDEEVSFNKTTGERTFSSDYQDAIIIQNGQYVKGKGGGACQASTTLYNALIRADVEILEVNNHSLPVKYVPLAFDAMVNDTTSDLIFKNTTGHPLYLMTGADDEKVYVKIFGAPMEDGLEIKTRSETVREIKKGDKIIPDTNGEYSNQITFKGEYYRVKYPQNGKECKGYLQYYKNGELIEEKEVRHAYYQGQEGIIMEGTEDVIEGITLPTNTVEFITGN